MITLRRDYSFGAYFESPPFLPHGLNGIVISRNARIGYGATILQQVTIGVKRLEEPEAPEIGNNVFIAPNVGIYTAGHPLDARERARGLEYAYPVSIGDDVWIGAGVSILPGVCIGARSVIGAGSVVTKDIPEDVLAFGNPCRIVKKINKIS